ERDPVALLQPGDDGLVVHDVVVDGDVALAARRGLGRLLLDGPDRHDDAGAEPARLGEVEALDHPGDDTGARPRRASARLSPRDRAWYSRGRCLMGAGD